MVKCHEFDKNGTELNSPDHRIDGKDIGAPTEKKVTSKINNQQKTALE